MNMQQNTLNLLQRIWFKISSPLLLLLVIAFLWLLSYGIFYYLLAWNMIVSAYLSLAISIVGAELSLVWAKRYLQKLTNTTRTTTPVPIKSPFYVPIAHDPHAFDKIVGMEKTIEVLKDALELPLKQPELIQRFGIKSSSGLILSGGPGTGKTALVRAASSYFKINLYLVNNSAITSERVGNTEKAIRDVFASAKANAPSLVFFDEIDTIGRRRDGQHLNRPSDLALNALLTELDGFVSREGVYVIGATNRFDVLDDALFRPGRFNHKIEVLPPDREGRVGLFQLFAREMPIEDELDWEKLADFTEGFTGAEIEECVQKTSMIVLKRVISSKESQTIVLDDFLRVINQGFRK